MEPFAHTFGHAGALVSALSSPSNSPKELLPSLAAAVRLHSVIENPGPFNEVSKMPEYIFEGLISHFVSVGTLEFWF